MFADMEGFTSLSERLGPEEAYTTMDQVYEILIHKVHDYEGTVNEMTGDGIMACLVLLLHWKMLLSERSDQPMPSTEKLLVSMIG